MYVGFIKSENYDTTHLNEAMAISGAAVSIDMGASLSSPCRIIQFQVDILTKFSFVC